MAVCSGFLRSLGARQRALLGTEWFQAASGHQEVADAAWWVTAWLQASAEHRESDLRSRKTLWL